MGRDVVSQFSQFGQAMGDAFRKPAEAAFTREQEESKLDKEMLEEDRRAEEFRLKQRKTFDFKLMMQDKLTEIYEEKDPALKSAKMKELDDMGAIMKKYQTFIANVQKTYGPDVLADPAVTLDVDKAPPPPNYKSNVMKAIDEYSSFFPGFTDTSGWNKYLEGELVPEARAYLEKASPGIDSVSTTDYVSRAKETAEAAWKAQGEGKLKEFKWPTIFTYSAVQGLKPTGKKGTLRKVPVSRDKPSSKKLSKQPTKKDKEALKWLKENPDSPEAETVRKGLKAKGLIK